jgi:hypothetical protein
MIVLLCASQKSFRVLCLSFPLEGPFPDVCLVEVPAGQASLSRTVTEHMDWLREEVPRLLLSPLSPAHLSMTPQAASAIANTLSMSTGLSSTTAGAKSKVAGNLAQIDTILLALQRQCAQFNASYVMVKNFIHHAAEKVLVFVGFFFIRLFVIFQSHSCHVLVSQLRAGIEKAVNSIIDLADADSLCTT